MTTSATSPDPVVVVGAGIAGLSAAVSAAEQGAPVVLVDRAGPLEAGGNTRWTSAYLRLDDVYEPSKSFVDELVGFSGGRTPSWYVEALVERLPEAMEWIQGHGARFRRLPTYFINSNRPRLQPQGGGEALLAALRPAAEKLGVEFRYHTTAQHLVTGEDGRVTGVRVSDPDGEHVLPARAVIIASGGFEGDPAALGEALPGDVSTLIPIAPGVRFNKGEGIRMALAAGAKRGGQWDSFHAEPVDPRADNPEALVMVFPYGILVNKLGERFLDEGRGTVDETYESTARAVWAQPGGIAYFITDRRFELVGDRERGLLTGCKPVTTENVEDLAAALELPVARLRETVAAYNKSVVDGEFDWRRPDGKHTEGLTPPKSNWALPVDEAPLLAYPVACAIVFTFGGLETDAQARVVDEQGAPIPGLYAAGECTGIYHDKYPGGTSVLRGLVFGRVAGSAAATA
ncbi:tricarballylate dehydrogenase [Amycolatopsis bartoniae]|uniref:Tricarballylate dehydrogenase n=1 Tax=Amycolatopsis bartoniae TaxID=941986 RepID=A0A8H9IYW9_9PSEU|nr:FAD-dependent oxidoreductase [Amycolatopsis bartoniae]MBB2938695.1 tricarballylate dehydrogenase [Amycolatopsis bartoniae]TVT11519.1 FAD-dependent oxidoreductase [Amycolatopsis bartoniae]GHF79485.1 tricarballylate dehydrogenase [Amycolatopsis bartoniae]